MTRFDLTPLFRSTVGFDHLSNLMDTAFESARSDNSYPPYNIEKMDEDAYRITMAVAGFSIDDMTITAQDNQLIVEAKPIKDADANSREFLHRGIAERAFEQRFHLADHIRVENASMDNGLLHIELKREVPEHMKPRTIKIGNATSKKLLGKGNKKAA